ncbi:unnamed protein product [Symbiodinium sp. CCMP2592]|nr:unnamed protein product [Symbiodinium sp. CCMP2592]
MVEAVAAAFAQEPGLKEVGLGFLCNHSGKLFTKKPSLKDVRCNQNAIFAVVKATNGASRLSWPHPADLQEGQDFQGPQVCKDKGDKDHDDEDSNDGVPAAPAPGIRMLSFETLSLASGSSSGSSTSGTLSSGGLSVRDSEVSRLASQLQGLRLLSKGSPGPSVGSTVTTTASLFDFAGKADSEPAQPAHIPSGNKPEKILPSRVFADLATWLPEPSKGFPLSSQYAGAFDAEDVDGIHEPPEDHEPKPKKAGNKKATKPKSKAGSKKAGPKSKAGSKETGPESKAGSQETEPETEELDPDLYDQYVPNLYGEKRLTYIATHAPQHGNKEAANMWNSSLQKARMLAGVSLRELKKRKFVPKEATENPFVKIVKQAKLAAVGGT